jgi:hypothetical protein
MWLPPWPQPSPGGNALCSVPNTQRHNPPQRPWLPGYTAWCAGAIQGKDGGIQVLVGLASSSKTVGSNIRVIHEQAKHSSLMTEANIALATLQQSWVSQEAPKRVIY